MKPLLKHSDQFKLFSPLGPQNFDYSFFFSSPMGEAGVKTCTSWSFFGYYSMPWIIDQKHFTDQSHPHFSATPSCRLYKQLVVGQLKLLRQWECPSSPDKNLTVVPEIWNFLSPWRHITSLFIERDGDGINKKTKENIMYIMCSVLD